MTLALEFAVILILIGIAFAIREALQFYRWTDHVRRVKSDYLLGDVRSAMFRDDLHLGP
jgi:hypothetical protein